MKKNKPVRPEAAPVHEAIERIEAALQAALGADGAPRPEVARLALGRGAHPDAQLEAWLEAVAAEIRSSASALVPEDMVEAIAERLLVDRARLLEAHGRVSGPSVRNLVRRS